MPTIPLHLPQRTTSTSTSLSSNSDLNPLPPLLHTPTGLALLELQGTVHFPPPNDASPSTRVGNLVFPLYNPELNGEADTKWMKRVYLYIGENQRMAGEVRKLGKGFAVVRRVERRGGGDVEMQGVEGVDDQRVEGDDGGTQEELQIVELVKHKIVFSTRPEPVTKGGEEG
jgi:chromosome transmission fidelity protein 8